MIRIKRCIAIVCAILGAAVPTASFAGEPMDCANWQSVFQMNQMRIEACCGQRDCFTVSQWQKALCIDSANLCCEGTAECNGNCKVKKQICGNEKAEAAAEVTAADEKGTVTNWFRAIYGTGHTEKKVTDEAMKEEGTAEKQDHVAVSGSAAQEILSLVNQERESRGLEALLLDDRVNEVAQAKAKDMADNGYFSHTSPTYGTPFEMMKTFGVTYSAAGENIAEGYDTAAAVMDGWMNSSGHRANILSEKYDRMGVGMAADPNGTLYWVQMFIH